MLILSLLENNFFSVNFMIYYFSYTHESSPHPVGGVSRAYDSDRYV